MEFFFQVKSVMEVLSEIKKFFPLEVESVFLHEACGRFLAKDLLCPEDLPPFSRSSMDGYAVRAKDVFGARENDPVVLRLCGEIHMGIAPDFELKAGEAARIATGGMLPHGADAVVMVEYAEEIGDLVEIRRPVSPGENVLVKGEDAKGGEILLNKGTRLTPARIGLLASAGITNVPVRKRPRVAIISTGDELVCPADTPPLGKIRDVNSYSLAAAVIEAGGIPLLLGIVPDNTEALYQALAKALSQADVVLISGGSSVGTRDYTLSCISRFPRAELICHGVAIRPGKPTILACIDKKAVFGLPGQIASAILVFYILVRPLLLHLQGALGDDLYLPHIIAYASRNISSAQGREDFVRVKLYNDEEGNIWADPIFGKSGLIFSMAKADGFLHIPKRSEGIYKGEKVKVFLIP